MNELQALFSQPWVERLGWSLVHFLWQGLSIAVLYAAAHRVVGRTWSPQVRYLLACVALTAMMAAPLVTYGLMLPWDLSPSVANQLRSVPRAGSSIATTATLPASIRATVTNV